MTTEPGPSTGAATTPVGRRLVLGLVALGALGIATGAAVQNALDGAIGAVANRDPTGLSGLIPGSGGFRYYSVTGTVPSRSTAEYTPHGRRASSTATS